MLDDAALDLIFRTARTHNSLSGEVTDAQLRALWDVMKFGPTTGNSQPARLYFLRSQAAKERLKPAIERSGEITWELARREAEWLELAEAIDAIGDGDDR